MVDETSGHGEQPVAGGGRDGELFGVLGVAEACDPACGVVGAAQANQAPLAKKFPEGQWASPLSLRSLMASRLGRGLGGRCRRFRCRGRFGW